VELLERPVRPETKATLVRPAPLVQLELTVPMELMVLLVLTVQLGPLVLLALPVRPVPPVPPGLTAQMAVEL